MGCHGPSLGSTVYRDSSCILHSSDGIEEKNLVPAELVENVRQLLAHGKLKNADQACRERPCPLSFVLVSGISEIEYGWPAVEKALEDSTAEQAARGGFLTFRLCRGL